jgi:hypothetical protein
MATYPGDMADLPKPFDLSPLHELVEKWLNFADELEKTGQPEAARIQRADACELEDVLDRTASISNS